ncbi:M28 family peptidase [Bacteroidota bacterium]
MKKILLSFLIILFINSCSTQSYLEKGEFSFNKTDHDEIKSNMEFLASDELEGREATSRGEQIASLYIATELKKYGVKPFGDTGTYFQNFELLSTKLSTESKIAVSNEEGVLEYNLNIAVDFAVLRRGKSEFDKRHKLLFAGYGISAEEYEYNDYEDIDAEGKIVIIYSGEPYSINEDFFEGEKQSKYSSPWAKIETAREKGAEGVLFMPGGQLSAYWGYLSKRSTSESFSLPKSDTEEDSKQIPVVIISPDIVENIFTSEEYELSEIEETVEENDIPVPFDMEKMLSFNFIIKENLKTARNVVGIIEGNDEEMNDQFITIGAHYDHEGIVNSKVYNGADDNASGTVCVMNAAKHLAELNNNKRSILVLLYTAEEKGIFGSNYFVNNFDEIDDVVVNVNLDMVGRQSVDTIFCIGADRVSNEFNKIVKESNANSANYFLDYSLSDTRLFYQSDHYSFAKNNIPVVFFFDNMRIDLHKPTDDYDKLNYEKIYKTSLLVQNIALRVANLDHDLVID